MDGIDIKELLYALKMIRNVCKDNPDNCTGCPLRTYGGTGCMLKGDKNPEAWKFADEATDKVPRLFK